MRGNYEIPNNPNNPTVNYWLGMYSGLLPRGLTEDDLSADDEERKEGEKCGSSAGGNTGSVVEAQPAHAAADEDSDSPTCSIPGISQEMWQVC